MPTAATALIQQPTLLVAMEAAQEAQGQLAPALVAMAATPEAVVAEAVQATA